ncbi:hypothetical protein ABDJ41_05670 [Pedobacter sp. ASV1-7]|uniref:hypothetical protein n=1 Tax=Pedobacter sp. ASV1-7 TaxID=3145237 RepID=UPI0032E8ACC2
MFNNNRLLKFRNILGAALLAAVTLVSCGKDDELSKRGNVLEFETTTYSIPQSGELVMKIVTTAPVSSDVSIPFTISGTAEKGIDFDLSASAFVIPAGSKIGEVKVTAKPSFDLNKSFKVVLGSIPSGINAGNLLFTEVSIGPKDILIYSFESQKLSMTENVDVNLTLTAAEGTFISPTEMRIPVELIPGTTTAVEGVHFSFDGLKEFVVPAGKLRATLKLKFLKQEVGKTTIALKVVPKNNHFVAGNFNRTNITIDGSNFSRLKGTWKYKAFTNRNWIIENIWGMDDEALFPKNNTDDLIIIDETTLNVQMTGDLKNYFRTATITDKGEVTERLQEAGFPPPAVKMQLVQLSAANVFFSPLKQKIRSTELGFRVFVESGKDILEVTVRDYEPTDFLSNTYEMYSSFGDVPAMKTMPLRFHFERVN